MGRRRRPLPLGQTTGKSSATPARQMEHTSIVHDRDFPSLLHHHSSAPLTHLQFNHLVLQLNTLWLNSNN